MSESINFVKNRRKLLSKRQEIDRKFFKYSSIVLAGMFVLFLASLGARLGLAYQLKTIKDQEEAVKRQVIDQEENERSFVIFISKLNSLSELFAKRKDKQQAIKFFTQAFDDSVLISNISYDADDSILSFGLKSDDIFSIEKVFGIVRAPAVKDQFQTISLSQLKRGQDGSYQLAVTVVLKGATPPPETKKAAK